MGPDPILSIVKYFILLTRIDLKKVEEIKSEIKKGKNPMFYKKILAYEIVKFYHLEKMAEKAQDGFEVQFQKKGVPKDIQSFKIKAGNNILSVLKQINFVSSNSEARRKINEGAMKIDDEKVEDVAMLLNKGEKVIKLGKKIAKLIIADNE